MSFDLHVEFTGLCMFVVHAVPPETHAAGEALEADRVTVVIPDCRNTIADPTHLDATKGKHHVGYMRLDLANVVGAGVQVPSGTGRGTPPYEVVHRFNGQTLDFGLDDRSSILAQPRLPELGRIAPGVEPQPALFSGTAGTDRLAVMRTTLRGGSLVGGRTREWEFSDLLAGSVYSGAFAETVAWSREVPGDSLTLSLTPFGETEPAQRITLHPVLQAGGRPAVSLKIANLCCENPLEWPELESTGEITRDEDFKWFYRSMMPLPGKSFREMLTRRGKLEEFPVPEKKAGERGGQGCVGMMMIQKP